MTQDSDSICKSLWSGQSGFVSDGLADPTMMFCH